MNSELIEEKKDIKNIERRIRSLTQRIILLDIIKGEDNDIFLKILGSTNNVYTIHIWLDFINLKCDCTCPDNKYRKIECKHIIWLSLKKLNIVDTKLWTIDDINNFYFDWSSIYSYPEGRNDTCPICLENIDYEKENTISCYHGCNNSVHSFCWNKYYIFSRKINCVFCRKLTMPIVYD